MNEWNKVKIFNKHSAIERLLRQLTNSQTENGKRQNDKFISERMHFTPRIIRNYSYKNMWRRWKPTYTDVQWSDKLENPHQMH